jgi:hypothetical protein
VSRSNFSLILPVLGVTLRAACSIKPWPLSESLSMRCVCVCARAVCWGVQVNVVHVLLAVVARFLSLSARSLPPSLPPSLSLSLSRSLSLSLSLSLPPYLFPSLLPSLPLSLSHIHTHARAGGGDGRMASVARESHVHDSAWRTGLFHEYLRVRIHTRARAHTHTHTHHMYTHTNTLVCIRTHARTHTHTLCACPYPVSYYLSS